MIPDKQLYYDLIPEFSQVYEIISSRGCPYRCPYCSHSMYQKHYDKRTSYYRNRSVTNVINELKKFSGHYRWVNFVESLF